MTSILRLITCLCVAQFFLNWANAAQVCPPGYPRTTLDSEFINNGNGTVHHSKTGLIWKRCAEGQTWDGTTCVGTAENYTWQQAFTRVADVNAGASGTWNAGQRDWRLPSINELKSIVEQGCYSPSINLTQFPTTPNVVFWTNSPVANSPDYAWHVHFGFGYSSNGIYSSNRSEGKAVRLVRQSGSQVIIPPDFTTMVDSFGFFDSDHAGQNTFAFGDRIETFRYFNNTGENGHVAVHSPNASAQGAMLARNLAGTIVSPVSTTCGWNASEQSKVIGKCALYEIAAGQGLDITIQDYGYIDNGSFPVFFNLIPLAPISKSEAEWRTWAFEYAYWRSFDSTVKSFLNKIQEVDDTVYKLQVAIDIADALSSFNELVRLRSKGDLVKYYLKIFDNTQQISSDLIQFNNNYLEFFKDLGSTTFDGVVSCATNGCASFALTSFASVINNAFGLMELADQNRKVNAFFIARHILEDHISHMEDWLTDEQIVIRASMVANSTTKDCRWYEKWFQACGMSAVNATDVVYQYRLHQSSMEQWIGIMKQRYAGTRDFSPNDIVFRPVIGMPTSMPVVSLPVQITGLDNQEADWIAIGGKLSVSNGPQCGSNWSTRGKISNGQYACLQVATSDQPGTGAVAYMVVGATTGEFHVFTKVGDNQFKPSTTKLRIVDRTSRMLTLEAEVTDQYVPTLGGMTGVVVFKDGDRYLGATEIQAGTNRATLTVPVTSGLHTFSAQYIGSSSYMESISNSLKWSKGMSAGVLMLLME